MRIILLSFIALLLCGCNSDIFVDEFTPDRTEVTMSGDGSEQTIHFKSAAWSKLFVARPDINDKVTVTPAGGEPYGGDTLEGDGTISITSMLTDIVITRRGADVTVRVNYAIGNDMKLLWLEAVSEETGERFGIDVVITCVRGLEITDVDYILNSWSETGQDTYKVDDLSVDAAAPAPVVWQPVLSPGLLTFYRMSTDSEHEPLLNALIGEKIGVPTRTSLIWHDWALRGDEVPIMAYNSFAYFTHYPPLPSVTIQPGHEAELWVEMDACIFNANIKVKNIFTGKESEMMTFVYIYEPAGYNFKTNEN